jgi:hypothetical protein
VTRSPGRSWGGDEHACTKINVLDNVSDPSTGRWAVTVGPGPAWKPDDEEADIYKQYSCGRTRLGNWTASASCLLSSSSSSAPLLLLCNGYNSVIPWIVN